MIDAERIGRSIKTLREKAGYTQKDLAGRMFLSPMAVSKWERGLSVPDVSCLQRLAVVLDTDVDSILEASATYMNRPWKGMIYMKDDSAERVVNDKPEIDYLISYFLLAGIRHIIIMAPSNSLQYITNRYGNGTILGCSFNFYPVEKSDSVEHVLLESSKEFLDYRVMLLTRPFFLFGTDLTRFFQRVLYSNVSFSKLCNVKGDLSDRSIVSISGNTFRDLLPPVECLAQYLYYELPLMFFDYNTFLNSGCFSKEYARIPMDKGFIDIELTDDRSIEDASSLIRIIQEYNGYLLNCPVEIAWRRGMISSEDLAVIAGKEYYPEYTGYLKAVSEHIGRKFSGKGSHTDRDS